jgi:zinc/manganese transport system substrate-binding protein
VLLQVSGKPTVRRGAPGYFEAAAQLRLIEVPVAVDRAMGDIHPQGNPHVHLDPRNIAVVANALTSRLAAIDPGNAALYEARGVEFQSQWQSAITRWQQAAAPLEGVPVVVIHRDQSYLCRWLGLRQVATVEPRPGVPPSAGYLAELVSKLGASPPRMILRNAYNDPKAAEWLSARVHVPVVTLPYSVGGTPGAKDLYGLFDDTIERLLAVRP